MVRVLGVLFFLSRGERGVYRFGVDGQASFGVEEEDFGRFEIGGSFCSKRLRTEGNCLSLPPSLIEISIFLRFWG